MKNQSVKRTAALVLSGAMAVSMAGCGGAPASSSASAAGGAASATASSAGAAAPAETTLKVYMFGQAEGFEPIAAKFEEETKDTLNIKLDIVWSDSKTHREKIPLMMANQEEADLVFDAYWMNLSTMHNQGAYASLNDYFNNPDYPGLQAAFSSDYLEQVTDTDGNIFAVPFTQAAEDIPVIAYRKDLADKYSITIDSDENLEKYFQAVQADIDAGTLTMTAPFGIGGTRGFYWLDHDLYEKRDANIFSIDSSAYGIGMEMETAVSEDGSKVLGVATLGDPDEAYAAFPAPYNTNTRSDRVVNKLTKWAQYIEPDAQTEDDPKTNLFFTGKVAAIEGNISSYTDYANAVKSLGGEVGVYVYNQNMRESKPFVAAPLTAWNFLCVPQQSTKKDASMKFLDWLFTDSANHDLFEHGIEGTDWEAVGEDEYRKIEGSNYTFPGYEMTWNPNFIRTNADLPDDVKTIVKYGNDPATYTTSPIAGFTFDNTKTPELQTAYAAVSAIQTEYQLKLMLGLTGDAASAQAMLDEYYQKVESAGLETIRQAVNDQLQSYLDNKKA